MLAPGVRRFVANLTRGAKLRRSLVRPALGALMGSVFLATPAVAQRVALGTQWGGLSGAAVYETVVWDLPSGTPIFRSPRFAGGLRSMERGAVFSATGRYVLFEGLSRSLTGLVLVDLERGVETVLPWNFAPLAAHPRDTAFFGVSAGSAARLDLSGLHVWSACGSDEVTALDPSPSGTQVALLCGSRVVVVDGATGQPTTTFPVAAIARQMLWVGADAVLVGSGSGLQRHELPSGTVVASRADRHALAPAGPRSQALTWTCTYAASSQSCPVALIDTASLADLRTLAPGWPVDRAFVTDDLAQLFTHGSYRGGSARWVDVASGVTRGELQALGTYSIGVGSAPLAPVETAAVVSGTTVTLTWRVPDHSTLPSAYVLTAGSQPGGEDVVFRLGAAPGFVASAVPPGRYYVRVRAVNSNGTSGVSNEIVVDVQ